MEGTAGIVIQTCHIQRFSRCWVWLCYALTLSVNFASIVHCIAQYCFHHTAIQFFTVVIVNFSQIDRTENLGNLIVILIADSFGN